MTKKQITITTTITITINKRNVIKIVKTVPLSSQLLDHVVTELDLHENERFWKIISRKQQLEEWFIDKYADKLDWFDISMFQKLSDSLIEKYEDKINWLAVSEYQKLSEQFIEKYKDKLDWCYLCIFQDLSSEFVVKHIDKISSSILENPCFKTYPDSVKLLLKRKFNKYDQP